MPPDDTVSLREFMDHRLRAIENQLASLRSAIEKLSMEMVRLESVNEQVAEHDKRIRALETDRRVIKVILGLMGTVTVPIAIDVIKGWLGM